MMSKSIEVPAGSLLYDRNWMPLARAIARRRGRNHE